MHGVRGPFRSLLKSPGFFLVATACLGLALALNTTTLAILDAMVHPALPVKDAKRLFVVQMWGRQAPNDAPLWERFQALRLGKFYEEMALLDWSREGTVRAGAEVLDQGVFRVSSNFYPLLGVRPERGRLPGPGTPEDVAVVSHQFWERTLGGRSLDGLTIWVNGGEYRVVGVLPSAMTFPPGEVTVVLPRTAEQTGAGTEHIMPVVKVRRGVTREALIAQLAPLARRLSPNYAFVPFAIAARPRDLRQIHFAMAGAALVVLLIACANLASLMLIRGAARRREVALRLALGAGRTAVVRHLLAEGAVIAASGMATGLLLTLWAVPILSSRMPPSVATLGLVTPQVSWRVFAAGVLGAVATLAIFGLWPALRASDVALNEPLKDSATVTGRTRWRYHPLVIGEVALSLVLLMGVALLTRAASRLTDSLLGYDRRGLLEAWVWPGGVIPADSAQRLSRALLSRIAGLPEVRSVAALGDPGIRRVRSEFYDGMNGALSRVAVISVSEAFLRTMGVPVVEGRDFATGDEEAGAAIVDGAVASALWPDGRPVGRLIRIGGTGERWVRVVGVARAALVRGPPVAEEPTPEGVVYQAWRPEGRPFSLRLAIRATRLDGSTAVGLRHAIREAIPAGRAVSIRPWLSRWDTELGARRFLIYVFAAFSGFALLLAAIGLYGVVSYAVSQRMRELAVRVAVGAPRRDLIRLVAHDAAVMTLAGIGLGAFFAMWAGALLGGWLYDVYHTDALSLIVAEGVLLAAATAACLRPLLRATRADPIDVLRAI